MSLLKHSFVNGALPPTLSVDERCLLESEIMRSSLLSTDQLEPNGQHRYHAQVAQQVLEKFSLHHSQYKKPYLSEVISAGPRRLKKCQIPANYIPRIAEANCASLAARFGLTPPLHLAVREPQNRRFGAMAISHVHDIRIPPNEYVNVAPAIYVASPELALLQAAQLTKSSGELFVLASELCAVYVADKEAPFGILRRQALTSPTLCKLFLAKCRTERLSGTLAMSKAIRFVVSPCASSMEVASGLLVKTPLYLGGYGYKKLKCNFRIDTSRAFGDKKQHYRLVDAYLPNYNIALEYLGQISHRDSDYEKDSKRSTELAAIGLTVMVVDRANMTSFEALEEFMVSVLGRKTGQRDFGRLRKHKAKRRELFSSTMYALSHRRWKESQ